MATDNANVVHQEHKVARPRIVLKPQNEVLLHSVCHRQMLSVSPVTQPDQTEFAREIYERSTPI